jgi:uncharacterized protein YeaO (DUF488 family)
LSDEDDLEATEDHRTAPGSVVRVGRVYDARTDEDGYRVLVDRLWPRGLTKADADLDEWCRGVAPSPALRKWYHHDPTRFDDFAARYRVELDHPDRISVVRHLRQLAADDRLTLLTATRDPNISEAAVLSAVLRRSSRGARGDVSTAVDQVTATEG